MDLTPDVVQWDPGYEDFTEAEYIFLDFRGNLINDPAKRRTIMYDTGVFEFHVSEERCETVISSIVTADHNCVTDDEVKMCALTLKMMIWTL